MAHKRGNNAGSIYRRKSDGRWVGSITLDNGKRKVFYGKTQREVQTKVNEALYEQQKGLLASGPNITVQEYLINWLENVHKPVVRLSTYLNYQKMIKNYLVPGLGHLKLQKVTAQQIQAFYSQKIQGGLTAKTVNNIHVILHKALDNAVRWNYLPYNVCEAVTPPRIPRQEKAVLTLQQAHILLEKVKDHQMEALLALAITTGMRRGELLALRWQDINFEQGLVQIKRAVSYLQDYGYVESEPKTVKGWRQIKVPDFVLEALNHHHERQQKQEKECGEAWKKRDLVFTNAWGDYYSPSTMGKVFKRLLAATGLPHVRFHDLRHSAATIMLSMGIHPKVVQEILGHSQISMTLDIYSHVLPSMQDEVIKKWNDEWNDDPGAGAPVPV